MQNDTSYGRKSQPPRKQRKGSGGRGKDARSAFERVVEDLNVSSLGRPVGRSLVRLIYILILGVLESEGHPSGQD